MTADPPPLSPVDGLSAGGKAPTAEPVSGPPAEMSSAGDEAQPAASARTQPGGSPGGTSWSLLLLAGWATGAAWVLDKLDLAAAAGTAYPFTRWAAHWALAAVLGAAAGLAVYWAGGAWYHLRVRLPGGRDAFRLSRRLNLFTGLPVALAVLCGALALALVCGDAYFTDPVPAAWRRGVEALAGLAIVGSCILGLRMARRRLGVRPVQGLLLFVVLPLAFYALVYAGIRGSAALRNHLGTEQIEVAVDREAAGDSYGAEKALREALARFTHDARAEKRRAYNTLGVVLENRGEDARALDCYRRALILFDSGEADHHACFGNILLIEHKTGEAVHAFRRALELDPDNRMAHNNLGLIFIGLEGNHPVDGAAALPHNDFMYRRNRSPVTTRHLALNYFILERYADARPLYEELHRQKPNDDECRYFLGMCLFMTGADEAAGRLLGAADFLRRADVLAAAGKDDEADRFYLHALRRASPEDRTIRLQAQLGRAGVAETRGDLAAARTGYRLALALCPAQSADRYRVEGRLNLAEGRPRRAVAAYARCLELDAGNLEAHTALGRILLGDEDERLADYELALTHTEKAFALERNDDTRWNLGRNYYALERWPEALALFEEYVAAHPQDADAKYYLGIICYELGDLGRAQSLLIEAIALDPELRDEDVDEILRETGSGREQGKT